MLTNSELLMIKKILRAHWNFFFTAGPAVANICLLEEKRGGLGVYEIPVLRHM